MDVPRPFLTIAWGIGERVDYALESSMFVTGAAVQWLRDGLGIIEAAAETEPLAASLASNDGVYFVPALTGLGSPAHSAPAFFRHPQPSLPRPWTWPVTPKPSRAAPVPSSSVQTRKGRRA